MSNGELKPVMPTEEQATEIKVMPEQFYFKKMKVAAVEGGKKTKLILIVAIVVIVLGLMAGAAYLFTQSLKREAGKPATTPAVTPTPPVANVPAANVPVANVPPVNVPPPSVCGNGTCETGENSATCAADCPAPPPPVVEEPAETPIALDTDKDGLTDVEETLYGTDSAKSDADGDGYADGLELINLYNPTGFAPQKIEETNLVKIYTNPSYNYTVFYPTSWLVRALDETNSEAMFTSATGEFIQVIVEDNSDNLPLLDWYLSEAPGTSPADVGAATTKSGLLGIKSPDGLTAYFGANGKIYVISYNIGVKTELNYKSTFEMIVKSFKL